MFGFRLPRIVLGFLLSGSVCVCVYATSFPSPNRIWCAVISCISNTICIGIMYMGYTSGAAVSERRSEIGKSRGALYGSGLALLMLIVGD